MKLPWDRLYIKIGFHVVVTALAIYASILALNGLIFLFSGFPVIYNVITRFLARVLDVFSPLIIALVIAYVFDPVVDFFQVRYERFRRKHSKKHIKTTYKHRTVGTLLTYLTVLVVLATIIILLALSFGLKFNRDYTKTVKLMIDSVRINFSERYAAWQVRLEELGILVYLSKYITAVMGRLGDGMQNGLDGFIINVTQLGRVIINVLLGTILAFYILSSKEFVIKKTTELSKLFLPKRAYRALRAVVLDIHGVVSGYLRGQIIDAVIMATLITVYLSLIGVDFAPFIGIFSGFSNLVPFFGALIGFVLAVIAALLSGDPSKAVLAAIGIIALQQLDAYFIIPRVVGKKVEISPFLVLLSLSVGGALFGFWGMLFAVPLCGVLKIFMGKFIDYMRRKRYAQTDAHKRGEQLLREGQPLEDASNPG